MEFKVGDKVKILDRVGGDASYYPAYNNGMLKYAGTITSVKNIIGSSLVLDNNRYYWDKKAVKLVNEDKYLHPSELKDGDFIKIMNSFVSFIYIFKEYKDNEIYRYASIDLKNYRLNINPHIHWDYSNVDTKITYATEEDKQLLNQALLKEGCVWDNTTKKLQEIKVETLLSNSNVTINSSVMANDLAGISNLYPTISHTQYGISVDSIEEKINKEELNLFPTKKHYQLNFNY